MMDSQEKNSQIQCGKIFCNSTLTEIRIYCCFCEYEETNFEGTMLIEHLVENHKILLNSFDLKNRNEKNEEEYLTNNHFTKTTNTSSGLVELEIFSAKPFKEEASEIQNENSQETYKNFEILATESINIEGLNQEFDEDDNITEPNNDTVEYNEDEDRLKSVMWRCHLCEKLLTWNCKENHLKHKHGRDLRFDTKKKIVKHKKEDTEQQEYCFQCPDCPKSYKTIGNLNQHNRRVHIRVYKADCSYCDKKFHSSGERDMHEILHHDQELPKVCHLCGLRFANTQRMNDHISRTHSETTFDCKKCNMKFKLKRNLTRHENTHTNERPHKCNLCGKTFKYKPGLQRHNIVAHVGQRNYICKLCEKAFLTTSHISCHMKSHRIPYSRENVIFKK